MTQHSPVCVFANVCACACACARACVRACVSALTLPTRTLRRLHEPHAFLLVAGPPGGLQALSRAEAALVALGAQFRFPRVRAAEATTLHCARCSCSVRVRVRELFLPDPNHHAAEWCMSVRAGYQCFTQSTIPLWLRQDQTWLRGANGRPRIDTVLARHSGGFVELRDARGASRGCTALASTCLLKPALGFYDL